MMARRDRVPRASWRAQGDAFDELVLQGVVHVERMSSGGWSVIVGGFGDDAPRAQYHVGTTNDEKTARVVLYESKGVT